MAEIKQRIRALLPASKLNGRTKLPPKIVHDNTLYTSSSPSTHNAVLVYNYVALNIYIVADLSDNIIPVEKAVRLAVKGQESGQAPYFRGKVKFFDIENQEWKQLDWRAALSNVSQWFEIASLTSIC